MLLNLEGLNKTYTTTATKIQALSNVSVSLCDGEFIAIQGPSGSGKSTLLLTAGTMLAPDSGRVSILNETPYEMPANARASFRAKNIGFIFQQFHLVPYLSVFENVQAASLGLAASKRRTNAKVEQLLDRFGLTNRRRHYPSQLSVGERQRCCIARALLNDPRLLLADEPSGSLDEANANVVMQELRRFAQDGGAVMLVTHDSRAALAADRVYQMQNGILSNGI
jgi:ABC-type lipoprotein export system ATPase subunit